MEIINIKMSLKTNPPLALTKDQKSKIASLEKEMAHKNSAELHNKKLRTSLETGIPYNVAEMDVVKLAIMIGMIKKRAVFEGREKDNHCTLINMLFSPSSNDGEVPDRFLQHPKSVSEEKKLELLSPKMKQAWLSFAQKRSTHIRNWIIAVRQKIVFEIEYEKEFVESARLAHAILIESLDDDDDDDNDNDDIGATLNTLMLLASALFESVGIFGYMSFLADYVATLKRKIPQSIHLCLSPMDKLLTLYPGFEQRGHFDIIRDQFMTEMYFRCFENDPKLCNFNIKVLARQCCTPNLCCVTIQDMLSWCMVGPYENNPIAFVTCDFYLLAHCEGGHRMWVKDPCLARTCKALAGALYDYLRRLFFVLYKAIFNHCHFRDAFIECPILVNVVANILFVKQTKKFTDFCQKIIKCKSTLMPTEKDYFNILPTDKDIVCKSNIYDDHVLDRRQVLKSLFPSGYQPSKGAFIFISNL